MVLREGSHVLVVFSAALACAPACLLTIDEDLIPGGAAAGGSDSGAGGLGGAVAGGGAGGIGGEGGTPVEPPGSARILFSDLEGGPNTGGEDDNGAFVTIVGLGFGVSQGRSFVTVGSGEVAAYRAWSNSRVVVQLGSATSSGAIVVHVEGDGASTGVPFEVWDGQIRFASIAGVDAAEGSFDDPFLTMKHCVDVLASGDICYARNGVVATADSDGAALVLPVSLVAERPKALLSYPGEQAKLDATGDKGLLACNDVSGCADDGHWVVAQLRIEAPTLALDARQVEGIRFVGNSVSCSSTTIAGDCLALDEGAHHLSVLGNTIAVPSSVAGSTPSVVRIGSQVHDVDFGWNNLDGPAAHNGIRVAGAGVGGLSLHDNVITDVARRGIDLFGYDLTRGPITIANNIFARNRGNGLDSDACLGVQSGTSADSVMVVHNTFYDCGGPLGAAVYADSGRVALFNNILAQPDATAFVRAFGFGSALEGSDNLFDGTASAPSQTDNNATGDAAFTQPEGDDFHLLAGSAAIDIGGAQTVALDRDGRIRTPPPDAGAYEHAP